jgi:threonine/homoserine/homoserine lactone efflux protein
MAVGKPPLLEANYCDCRSVGDTPSGEHRRLACSIRRLAELFLSACRTRNRRPGGPHLSYGYTRTLLAVFRLALRIVYNSTMFDSLFWAFLALAALLTITPGADTVLTLRNTLAGGTRDGLWTMAGVCSGFVFQPLLAAFGVAALFVRLPVAFAVVKLAGAIYLIYLGGQTLREAVRLWRKHSDISEPSARGNHQTRWKRYREGLLTNALNPKIGVFYFAVLPQFIKASDPVLLKSILMTLCHYAMGMLWLGAIALAAGRFQTLLTRPRIRASLDAIAGLSMIGFGARLACARAR